MRWGGAGSVRKSRLGPHGLTPRESRGKDAVRPAAAHGAAPRLASRTRTRTRPLDCAGVHVMRGGAGWVGEREGSARGREATAGSAAVAAAWPRSTGV